MTAKRDANEVEAERWLLQAERDLAAAESNQRSGYHEWAYISSRYPNGLTLGTPGQFYEAKDAEECRSLAREIIDFVKQQRET